MCAVWTRVGNAAKFAGPLWTYLYTLPLFQGDLRGSGHFVVFTKRPVIKFAKLRCQPGNNSKLMAASYCLLLWQPVLALHPAPRAAPALGARRTAPPARAVRHDSPRMSTDSNPDSLEDVFEALLKARRGLCLGLGLGLGLPLTTL